MPAVAIIVETNTKQTPIAALGYVRQIFDYQVLRDLNQIGSFMVSIAVDEPLGLLIRRGWRITLIEEGTTSPQYLLYRGIVITRKYTGVSDGAATLELTGLLQTQDLAQSNTHSNMIFNNATVATIVLALAGAAISTPAGASNLTVTFNNITKYAALLKLGELKRWNLRETFSSDALEFVSTDALPDSGWTIQTLEDVSGDLSQLSDMKIALLADMPTIEYNGENIITRIIPTGNDVIDDPASPGNDLQTLLTLEHATRTAPYAVRRGTNPDGTFYWYLQDDFAQSSFTNNSPIELYEQRSDVSNPTNSSPTRIQAANVLFDVSASELFNRRSEFITLTCELVNGFQCYALPGDAIRVEYEGDVYNQDTGKVSYVRLSRYMMITKRTDKMGNSGEREVTFAISSPLYVPTAATIVIPPPPGNQVSPMDPGYLPNPYGSIPTGSPAETGFTDPTAQITDGSAPPAVTSLTPSDLYAVAGSGYWRLANGGSAWISKNGAPPLNPRYLYSYDGGVLYHAGNSLEISTDYGETWSVVVLPVPPGGGLANLFCVEAQVSYTDGRTWIILEYNLFSTLWTDVYVYDGSTWTQKLHYSPSSQGFTKLGLSLVDSQKVVVSLLSAGGNAKMWVTLDGGTTWTQEGPSSDPGIGAQQVWFFTNTGRMIAAQAYNVQLRMEYSDSPATFHLTDHVALTDATANSSGFQGQPWMLARDYDRGAIFLGISVSADRIYRSTDNGTTFVQVAAYPATTGLCGLQYDYAADRLYALFGGATGRTYYLSSASTRNFATVVTGDWTALAVIADGFNIAGGTRLAILHDPSSGSIGEVL